MMYWQCPACGEHWDGGLNDTPASKAESSAAMKAKLTKDGLGDMEPLLRLRGCTSAHALDNLNDMDRAMFLGKARALYTIYGTYLNPTERTLLKYFGERGRQQPRRQLCLDTACFDVPAFRLQSTGQPLEDTIVRNGQGEALRLAWGCMPSENVVQCRDLLRESDDLAEAARSKAAEALLVLCVVPSDPSLKEQHKLIKNHLRDVYAWRYAGQLLGMDLGSTTMDKVWRDTAEQMTWTIDDRRGVFSSQMTNAWKRLREGMLKNLLQVLPHPKTKHKQDDDGVVHPALPANQALHAGSLAQLKDMHEKHQPSLNLIGLLGESFAAELKELQTTLPPPPPPPPLPLQVAPTPPPTAEDGSVSSRSSSCSSTSSGWHAPSRPERMFQKQIDTMATSLEQIQTQMAAEKDAKLRRYEKRRDEKLRQDEKAAEDGTRSSDKTMGSDRTTAPTGREAQGSAGR